MTKARVTLCPAGSAPANFVDVAPGCENDALAGAARAETWIYSPAASRESLPDYLHSAGRAYCHRQDRWFGEAMEAFDLGFLARIEQAIEGRTS